LCWNIHGVNSEKKWNAIYDRIKDCHCDVICLQETKRENFDDQYLRKICPPSFDKFVFLPSVGPSGGSIIIWKSMLFQGTLVFQNSYTISVEFFSLHENAHWILTNVYAPCTHPEKREFIQWFRNINMPDSVDWLIVGDFNLYRSPEDRNQPGGDHLDMYLFNEAISKLGLVDIPLKGRRFTWSNKHLSPLLERLDWFFTSTSWTISYPNTYAYPLTMETSDHVPCAISVSTKIPKSFIFRFENYWLQHPGFISVVQQHWTAPSHLIDTAKILTAKFKNLRAALKVWKASLSNLKVAIDNVKLVLAFLQFIEELRDLTIPEWNFKGILESELQNLLKQQKAYWKQRGQIK
jgi:exonuclease III